MSTIAMLWNSFNEYLNHNTTADVGATVTAATFGLTVHFAEFDLILKLILTSVSIVFVAYRLYSHHEDRKDIKNTRNNTKRSDEGL
jgi:hypothetical protein